MIKTEKWDQVFLGEIANEISERVDNPSQSGFEMFVGLEHFVSGDLKIKQWGSTKNLVSAMKKFQKGNILFARRNAYLKRASIVEFDGVCSGDAFVIREKKDRLVPGFLAFIFNSESLWHYANSYAAGTMSKRVKWRDLAKYSFKLPPLDEQKRLADLLWSVDKTITAYEELLSQELLTRSVVLKDIFLSKTCKITSINELPIKEINGMWKTVEAENVMQVSIIRSTEIYPYGEISYNTAQKHVVKKSQFADKKLIPGDIIIERSGGGPDQPVGRVCYFDKVDGNYTFSNFTSAIRIEDQNEVLPKYLFNFLLFFYEMKGTDRLQKQTTGIRNLDYDLYRKIKIPMRNIEEQKECINTIEKVEKNRRNIEAYIVLVQRIKKQIINQIFG